MRQLPPASLQPTPGGYELHGWAGRAPVHHEISVGGEQILWLSAVHDHEANEPDPQTHEAGDAPLCGCGTTRFSIAPIPSNSTRTISPATSHFGGV